MRIFDVTAWRRDVLASKVPLSSKVVAMVLHEHMDWTGDDAGGNCWPGLETIGEESGLDRRTVTRALDTLQDHGFMERMCRRGCDPCRGGNGHRMNYFAHVPQPWHDATAEQWHDATAEANGGASQQGRDATANSGNGAPSSGMTPRQGWHDATGPSLDLPLNQSKDLPGSSPPGGASDDAEKKGRSKFELGKSYATRVAAGDVTETDVTVMANYYQGENRREFLEGYRDGPVEVAS